MNLKFGTGGLRATMGPGPDHLNIQTIQEATLGVAAYAREQKEEPSAAIAYDSRTNSELFARETARVLAGKGIKVFIYPKLMPTPALSFAVRHLKCDMGICITASHNPSDYNGYKVYGSDGGQITSLAAEQIQHNIENADYKEAEELYTFEQYLESGAIRFIEDRVLKAFLGAIGKRRTREGLTGDLKVVYTPLHGAGLSCVTSILKYIGIKELQVVPEQAKPDGAFPTCPYPNPEEPKALDLGLKWCQKVDADILIATDPDSDRVGVAAKKGQFYKRLNGNQVGILLLHYLLNHKKETGTMPENPVMIRTIVSTAMADAIAGDFGVSVIKTLTGFKYIGEQIGLLEKKGAGKSFVFGFEESCGYLIGTYVRDKDAVGASMLICEMADAYKAQGKTLWDVLEELYAKYGHYETTLKSYEFQGQEAEKRMRMIRNGLKNNPEMKMHGSKVVKYRDYLEESGGLPKSDVLELWMEDKSKVVIRPSGTEPKIKVYTETVKA